jgi:hypothetical protein
MQYSDGYLREVLPNESPSLEFVPPEIEAEIRFRGDGPAEEDRQLVARCARWTYAMFNELRLGQVVIEGAVGWSGLMLQMAERVGIGLYDPEVEERGFGISILVPRSKNPPFERLANVNFPRLKQSFPLVVRQAAFEEHAAGMPNPVGATSATWAKCNRTSVWGVLTAGHAAPVQPGQAVALAPAPAGVLLRSSYPVVDAAFVVVGGVPARSTLMKVLRFPAAGNKAFVECQGGPVPRTVVSVFDSRGVTATRRFMIAFFTDTPCSPGDSGSLVRSPSGEAMGIYSGSVAIAAGGHEGFAQNFEQATFALDVTAYQ